MKNRFYYYDSDDSFWQETPRIDVVVAVVPMTTVWLFSLIYFDTRSPFSVADAKVIFDG